MCINLQNKISCCKGCTPPDRRTGCHSTCEKYLKEKEDWDNYKLNLRKEINKANLVADFHVRSVERCKRVKTGMY